MAAAAAQCPSRSLSADTASSLTGNTDHVPQPADHHRPTSSHPPSNANGDTNDDATVVAPARAPVRQRRGFVPRNSFPLSTSLPKTYFLGHHAKTLREIRDSISMVHLLIECRDARLPLTTWNPELEAAAAGRSRIVAYTKSDLLSGPAARARHARVLEVAASRPSSGLVHEGSVMLCKQDPNGVRKLLRLVARVAAEKDVLTGLQCMVIGMPNVGKSTLLNLLRTEGMQDLAAERGLRLGKAARTGEHPGITRSIGTGVRVLNTDPPVFLKDTPGVFVPYVPDPEAMVKLALVAGVKHNLIPDLLLVDYLLYRMNLRNPALYSRFQPEPTNDLGEFLTGIARSTQKLRKGGQLDLDAAAAFVLHRYRDGSFGKFFLDDMSPEGLETRRAEIYSPQRSTNSLRKEAKKQRAMFALQKQAIRRSD